MVYVLSRQIETCITISAESLDPAGFPPTAYAGVARLPSMKRFECGSGLRIDRTASNNYTRV
jgi:hypothetical protein